MEGSDLEQSLADQVQVLTERIELMKIERSYLMKERDYWKDIVTQYDGLYEHLWEIRLGAKKIAPLTWNESNHV